MTSFSNIKALIIDMDGVLWHGNRPLPGLNEFFSILRNQNIKFVLATNNATQTPDQYVEKLGHMGVVVAHSEVLTSAVATSNYLAETYSPQSTRVFVIGETGITTPLNELGFQLTALDDISAHIVVCGLDKSLTWNKLATAALNLQNGAEFFATNGDTTLPTEQGFVPGNGATIAALKKSTGISPTVIGKPETNMYNQALQIMDISPAETLVIGDRLDTDILGAVNCNIRSVMLLTGISNQQDIDAADYGPDWVMQDLNELNQALQSM